MQETFADFEAVSAEVRASLIALCMEYVWRVDHGFASSVWELFTPDGVCDLPWGTLQGHDRLRSGWAERALRPIRTRHLISNWHFMRRDESTVAGVISMSVYAGEPGSPMVAAPLVVGDHLDEYRRNSGGRWRIHHRRFQVAFSNAESMPAPPMT